MADSPMATFKKQVPAILGAGLAAFFLAVAQGLLHTNGVSCTVPADPATTGALGLLFKTGHTALTEWWNPGVA